MKKVYYIGIAVILILIVVALLILVRGLQERTKKTTEGLLPEEVAEDQVRLEEGVKKEIIEKETEKKTEKDDQKELPKTKSKTTVSGKSQPQKTESPQPRYEYYMKQTQTVTIELPNGTDYSKTCTNNKCEIVIY